MPGDAGVGVLLLLAVATASKAAWRSVLSGRSDRSVRSLFRVEERREAGASRWARCRVRERRSAIGLSLHTSAKARLGRQVPGAVEVSATDGDVGLGSKFSKLPAGFRRLRPGRFNERRLSCRSLGCEFCCSVERRRRRATRASGCSSAAASRLKSPSSIVVVSFIINMAGSVSIQSTRTTSTSNSQHRGLD